MSRRSIISALNTGSPAIVERLYQDREGTLWAATSGGVDSFRDLRVTTFSTREGLSSAEIDSVIASRDGSVWIAGAGTLDNLRDGRVTTMRAGKGLPGFQVTSLLEDRSGRLWIGIDRKLMLYADGRFPRSTGRTAAPSVSSSASPRTCMATSGSRSPARPASSFTSKDSRSGRSFRLLRCRKRAGSRLIVQAASGSA
jgi:ligand-binding sensor domain-containing protein